MRLKPWQVYPEAEEGKRSPGRWVPPRLVPIEADGREKAYCFGLRTSTRALTTLGS
jgi:hypothetical protein